MMFWPQCVPGQDCIDREFYENDPTRQWLKEPQLHFLVTQSYKTAYTWDEFLRRPEILHRESYPMCWCDHGALLVWTPSNYTLRFLSKVPKRSVIWVSSNWVKVRV